MDNYVIIILIVAVLIVLFLFNKQYEGFHLRPSMCKKCGTMERMECNRCINCGYYIGYNGKHGCVSGDEDGPTDPRPVKYWEYAWPYGYYKL